MRPQRPALLAWLAAAVGGAHAQSTVSVYLPEYGDSEWAALRGSVLSSDESVTAYTVFCAEKDCQIAGNIPFVFTEGPHTLVHKGADPGTLTADLDCELDGKTAATCTGSSSFGSNYRAGTLTGPAQTVWTSTFTAAEVTWGVLTLSTPASSTGTLDLVGTVVTATAVPTSEGNRLLGSRGLAMASGAVLLGLLFG